MKKVEQLARNLLIRMREIDDTMKGHHRIGVDDPRPPDGDDYNLLWDAILDEIKAACPDLSATVASMLDNVE